MTTKEKHTIGEVSRLLDAALEHASHAWGRLAIEQGRNPADEHGWPPEAHHHWPPGTSAYHLAALITYLHRGYAYIQEHVPQDWQICPYEGCGQGCGIDDEGYYTCPKCNRYIKAEYSDSEIEDIKLRRVETVPRGFVVTPAIDMGTTWASPKT